MFFGLTNSPATFQTMMDKIFEDLISEGVVVVYLHDILIFTKTLEEHQKVVHQVMEILQKNSLSLKLEKCEFERTSVEYLGVVVSHDSVKKDPAKVARVVEWPTLSTKKEVQSFLGFTNFYQRFIEGFSHIAQPPFLRYRISQQMIGSPCSDWIPTHELHGNGEALSHNESHMVARLVDWRLLK